MVPKRRFSSFLVLLSCLWFIPFTIGGCGKSSPYRILDIKLDPAEVRPGQQANLYVTVGKDDNSKVIHTDTLKVVVQSSPTIKIEGQVTSFEETNGNTVKITLRPGSNLPRQFKFIVTAPQEKGEYKLAIQLEGNGDRDEKGIPLVVKSN